MREDQDLWADILQDVSTATTSRDKKVLLVLGDQCIGKSTVIGRLRGTEQSHVTKPGIGLEYSFLDIRDQFSEDIVSRLGIWTVNSEEPSLTHTLKDISCSDSIWNSMVVIVVDYSQPWTLLERLRFWMDKLDKHIQSLKIDASEYRDLCGKLSKSLQEYALPGTEAKEVLLPLSEGVLEDNLGIPIAVVCTKVDAMATLEKDMDYTDAHFDLIQWHLRRFCLKYGAALFYLNGKESHNADILYKYLVHKMYGAPLTVAPSVVDKDCLMVPAGWDTLQKISILNDTLRGFNLDEDLYNVLSKPLSRRVGDSSREVKAEDDQAFLTRMQSLLQNQRPTPTRSSSKPLLTQQGSRAALPTSGTGSTPGAGGTGAAASEKDGVLANFFNSLLNNNRRAPPGAAGAPGSPGGGGPGAATTRPPSVKSATLPGSASPAASKKAPAPAKPDE